MKNENYIFGFSEFNIINIAILYKNYNFDYKNLHIYNTYIPNDIATEFLKYKKFNKISNKLKDWSINYVDNIFIKNQNTILDESVKEKNKISGFIYVYKQGKYYKIGKSKYEDCRKSKYITENPEQIELVYKYRTSDYTKEEQTLHNLFKEKRVNQKREWFLLSEQDISLIKRMSV